MTCNHIYNSCIILAHVYHYIECGNCREQAWLPNTWQKNTRTDLPLTWHTNQ